MPYGIIKVDTLIYTSGGLDATGLVSVIANGTFPSLQTTGTISGSTVTGSSGLFTSINVATGTLSQVQLADSDGSNWVALRSPSVVASNVTWTLPNTDGVSGQVIRTDGSGNLGWNSVLSTYTTTVTATGKTLADRERCTITASGQTLTLPASPSAGSEVTVSIAGTFFDTVIARNGSNIMSLAENMTIDRANVSVTFYYVDATRGWRII